MTWWQRLVRGRQLERQLDAELRDHLQRQIADYVSEGLSEADARRRAVLEFGGLEQIREQCRDARGTRFVEDAIQDTRYAVRTLAKRPGFTCAVILLLGLGIGVNTAIFSLLHAVLFREVVVHAPNEIYFVAHRHGQRSHATSNYPLIERVRDRGDVFASLTAYVLTTFKVASGDAVERVPGEYVMGNYHGALGIRFAAGRGFTAESDRPSDGSFIAVISDRYWASAFNRAPDIVGRQLAVDGRTLTIVGVTVPEFEGFTPGRPPDITVPLAMKVIGQPDYLTMHDTWTSLVPVARLKHGVSEQQATTAMDVIFRQYLAEPDNAWYKADSTVLFPARHGSGELRQRYSASLIVLMGMVLVVLAIAIANFALLQLARGSARAKEMSIRLSIGAGRWRLVRQLMTESLLLALAGGTLGLILASWGTSAITSFFRADRLPVVLNIQAGGVVLAFALVITLVTGLVCGLTPALAATRLDLVSALKDLSPSAGARVGWWSVRRALVAGQVALCLLLVMGAGLLVRTLQNLQAPDDSFSGTGVTLFAIEARGADLPEDFWPRACATVLDRLAQHPDLASSACSTSTPLDLTESRRGAVVGDAAISGGVLANVVTPAFFRAFSIPLVRGRVFTSQDAPNAPLVGIINERLARTAFGDADPIGRTFHFRAAPNQRITIVGVVKDVRHNPREAASPTVYTALGQVGEIDKDWITLAVRSPNDRRMVADTLRSTMANVRSDLIVTKSRTFGEQMGGLLTRERALALLSGWFGVLALVLACVGLYGVMSQDVTRRRQEIGIRLALGAEPSRVLGGVIRDAALVGLTGILLGSAAAMATSKLISGLLFDVSARDPLTLGGAAVILAITTLLAGYLPARRAARVDPTMVLRSN
jgi:predicted permease